MNTRKLEPEEQLSSFDKILLMTGHINLMAANVHSVMQSRFATARFAKDNTIDGIDSQFFAKGAEETKKLLEETAKELHVIYEGLAEFCNGCDAVSDIDVQLGTPVYNAMNDQIQVEEEQDDSVNQKAGVDFNPLGMEPLKEKSYSTPASDSLQVQSSELSAATSITYNPLSAKKISLLHPSWKRPQMALECYNDWMGKCEHPEDVEYILCLSKIDPTLAQYEELFANTIVQKVYLEDNGLVKQANAAAAKSVGNILISISDDFSCPDKWDKDLLFLLEGAEDYIAKTDDGLQPWIMTLPLMDRKYYERFGYIYMPEYLHMFCDTEMTHVADLLGRAIKITMKFPHNHYTSGKMNKDEVNEANDATWAQGEALYIARAKENFGITPVAPLTCGEEQKIWLRDRGVNV